MSLLDALRSSLAAAESRAAQLERAGQQGGTAAAAASSARRDCVAVDVPSGVAGAPPKPSWAEDWRRFQVASSSLMKIWVEAAWPFCFYFAGLFLLLGIMLLGVLAAAFALLGWPFVILLLIVCGSLQFFPKARRAWQAAECSHPLLRALLALTLLLAAACYLLVVLVGSLVVRPLYVLSQTHQPMTRLVESFKFDLDPY